MKILGFRKLEGRLKLRVDNAEDLWALQRIVFKGDLVKSESLRRFKPSENDEGELKEVVIELKAEKVELDKNTLRLRITGKITEGRPLEYVRLNTYHTLNIGVHDVIEITKREWPSYIAEVIREAVEDTKKPRIAIVLIDEEKALPAYVLGYGIEFLNEIYSKLSKRMKPKEFEEQRRKYFDEVIEAIRNLNTDSVIIAGPGFTREDIKKYLEERGIGETLGKRLIYERASDTERSGMYELIKSDRVAGIISRDRVREEFKEVEEFLRAYSLGEAKYGIENVERAIESYESKKVLVNDSMLGNEEIKRVLDLAEKNGIRIKIINSASEAGVQLHGFKDIAEIEIDEEAK
ncbi:MAG: mRNA surveillance protein pelota [Candidatus Micrarchaeaceae archaeon]